MEKYSSICYHHSWVITGKRDFRIRSS